ncbi:MAG TPA: hypothetical protein PKN36_05390 [bacterium]|nr:hypothetical protein [bacterium]
MKGRAFILGAIFSVLTAMLDTYLVFRGLPGRFGWEYWAPAAIFLLFIMLVLSCIHKFFELDKSELLLIFVMVSVASVLPSYGLMHQVIASVVGLKYFATSANQWEELILSKISPLMFVQDENAVKWFFEGLPPGVSIPYGAWLKPMGFMLIFVLMFSFLSICIMVLFRKQWIEKERLMYPLMLLPLEMAKKEAKSRIPVLFKDKLFWLGFILVFSFYFFNWLSLVTTGAVLISLRKGLILSERFGFNFVLNPDFPILGFSYLIPRSVSLSMWLFLIFATVQNSIFNMMGFRLPGTNAPFGGRTAASTFQGGGAMIVLVFFLIWRARRHFSECFRKAFTKGGGIDDSKEILSYRTAVFGSILSFLAMACFLRYAGMPWLVSFAFLFFVLVVFIGLSRIVCQTGLPSAQSQCIGPAYTAYLLPPSLVTEGGYVALGFQYSWTASLRSSVMTTAGNMLRVQEDARISPRFLFAGVITAIIISYVASAWIHIYLAYTKGALNTTGTWFGARIFGGSISIEIAEAILSHLKSPVTSDIIISRYIFTGIGALIMGILVFLHSKFLWWPVHYIGFPISDSSVLRRWWFAIFLAWLIKGLILRFGGHNVYRKSVSFFLGLILSHISWTVAEILLNIAFKHTSSVAWF